MFLISSCLHTTLFWNHYLLKGKLSLHRALDSEVFFFKGRNCHVTCIVSFMQGQKKQKMSIYLTVYEAASGSRFYIKCQKKQSSQPLFSTFEYMVDKHQPWSTPGGNLAVIWECGCLSPWQQMLWASASWLQGGWSLRPLHCIPRCLCRSVKKGGKRYKATIKLNLLCFLCDYLQFLIHTRLHPTNWFLKRESLLYSGDKVYLCVTHSYHSFFFFKSVVTRNLPHIKASLL